jgi:hypothetical protein
MAWGSLLSSSNTCLYCSSFSRSSPAIVFISPRMLFTASSLVRACDGPRESTKHGRAVGGEVARAARAGVDLRLALLQELLLATVFGQHGNAMLLPLLRQLQNSLGGAVGQLLQPRQVLPCV